MRKHLMLVRQVRLDNLANRVRLSVYCAALPDAARGGFGGCAISRSKRMSVALAFVIVPDNGEDAPVSLEGVIV
ncbi:MAG: hypothetical protein ACKVOB_13375 [Sphingomonas sp.]